MAKKDRCLLNILFVFLLLTTSSVCFAFNLEINYPQLSTGEQLTSQSTVPQYAKYMFNWGMAIGFLSAVVSLIVAGALYILSVANPGAKAMAMDRVYGTITGLILLLLVYLIVTTINPELSIFKTETLAPIVPPVETISELEGVFLYESQNCTSSSSETNFSFRIGINSSLSDLAIWKNKVNSINIVAGGYFEKEKRLYFAILHDLINFQGKCEYFFANGRSAGSEGNSGDNCKSVKPYAASVSVYQYAENPTGNGVTFYRKPFYDDKGGSFKVNNNEIKDIYGERLTELSFNNVPEEERDCTEWDFNGNCLKKDKVPNLSGENINSIKIDGNYVVALAYLDERSQSPEKGRELWPSCQVFPGLDDKNKEGPRQIKWEYIRNQFVMPNYVIIFPIMR